MLQFDLVTNRDGSKYFVKPRKVEKDDSWKDAIASVVMQVDQDTLIIISLDHKFILKVFHDRKVPPNVLPLNPELMVRVKPAARPDKSDAIAKHQTRMKSTI